MHQLFRNSVVSAMSRIVLITLSMAAVADESMIKIPAGSFKIVTPAVEVHVKAFALGKYLVTRAEFEQFINETNYDAGRGWRKPLLKQTANDPVINVNWHSAHAYINWLNKKTGQKYRLPTEVEWEYAARAGTKTRYYWGDDIDKGRANCDGCGSRWDGESTAPVGSFAANPWGLFDMGGNAAQWTQDCFVEDEDDEEAEEAEIKAKVVAPATCKLRVIRGGGWNDSPKAVRVDAREGNMSDLGYMNVGFRLAKDL